jgi:hypothetical protein
MRRAAPAIPAPVKYNKAMSCAAARFLRNTATYCKTPMVTEPHTKMAPLIGMQGSQAIQNIDSPAETSTVALAMTPQQFAANSHPGLGLRNVFRVSIVGSGMVAARGATLIIA